MNNQIALEPQKQELLKSIVEDLQKIDGVVAIVLGGSYAEGLATPSSDMDIGIYYSENNPFDIAQIRSVAVKYSIKEPTVTDFYGWGPWVNGGAWITSKDGQVDFIYRNIDQVSKTIDNAVDGKWENDFEQQPPYGFSSIIYLAETKVSIPLYDPYQYLHKLKERVENYPVKLKESVVSQSLWSAEFSIWQADIFSQKTDIFNMMGCFTRAIKSIITAIYSLNEIYPMGDKRAIERLALAEIKPQKLKEQVENVLLLNRASFSKNVDAIKSLHDEAVALAGPLYKKYFNLK